MEHRSGRRCVRDSPSVLTLTLFSLSRPLTRRFALVKFRFEISLILSRFAGTAVVSRARRRIACRTLGPKRTAMSLTKRVEERNRVVAAAVTALSLVAGLLVAAALTVGILPGPVSTAAGTA